MHLTLRTGRWDGRIATPDIFSYSISVVAIFQHEEK